MDLNTAYEAIKISSGTSFVHETESQVILNGSRDISFTMDLVKKDVGLFKEVADRAGIPLEIAPMLVDIFDDGISRYGSRELSPNIIKRLEDATGLDIRAPGFPPAAEGSCDPAPPPASKCFRRCFIMRSRSASASASPSACAICVCSAAMARASESPSRYSIALSAQARLSLAELPQKERDELSRDRAAYRTCRVQRRSYPQRYRLPS